MLGVAAISSQGQRVVYSTVDSNPNSSEDVAQSLKRVFIRGNLAGRVKHARSHFEEVEDSERARDSGTGFQMGEFLAQIRRAGGLGPARAVLFAIPRSIC